MSNEQWYVLLGVLLSVSVRVISRGKMPLGLWVVMSLCWPIFFVFFILMTGRTIMQKEF